MPDWVNEFEHPSITTENKESFSKAMGKYGTMQEAVVGGFNAQKALGKPYKLPESMDKLPDDASRSDFASQARKLLGIEHAATVEALDGLDMKAGQAEGAVFDEKLATAFKTFIVDNKVNKADAQKMVGFYNQAMTKAAEAATAKTAADKSEATKTCNEALIAHFGSEEKVVEMSELLRRVVKDKMGLSAKEYEEFGEALAGSVMKENPVMAKGLLTALAPLAAEGSTDSGGGTGGGGGEGQKQTPYEYKKAKFPNSEELWGKPTDVWDTQTVQLKKQAGVK